MNLLRSLVVSFPLTSVIFSTIHSTDYRVTGFLLPSSCCSLFPLGNSISRREFIVGSGSGGFLLSSSTSASSDDSAPMTPSPSSSSSSQLPNTNTTQSIRWGIVGLGDVTQVKSGPPFWKCTGSNLVAVMRRTPGKAAEFAAKVPRTTTNQSKCTGYHTLDDLLHHPGGLDAVYVSTRPGTHVEIAQKVAAAGLACYVEKPVGRCAAETQALVALFAQHSLPLYTAYISRAYARTQAVRKLLHEDGLLGEKLVSVQYVLRGMGGARDMTSTNNLPWRLEASQSGGGLIMDVGCHVIDRLDYLCGPLVQVQGIAEYRVPENDDGGMDREITNPVVENYCHTTAIVGARAAIATPGAASSLPKGGGCDCEGATVDLTWDFSGTHTNDNDDDIDELRLVGSNGKTLTMAGMSPDGPIQVLNNDESSTIMESFSFDKPEHTAQQLIQAITNDLLDRKKAASPPQQSPSPPPRVDFLSFGENALRTQRVIDTMVKSYYGGREIGYWSRDRGPDHDPNPNVPSRPVQGQNHKSQAWNRVSCHATSRPNIQWFVSLYHDEYFFPLKKRSSTVVVIV